MLNYGLLLTNHQLRGEWNIDDHDLSLYSLLIGVYMWSDNINWSIQKPEWELCVTYSLFINSVYTVLVV